MNDKYEVALENKMKELKECQASKNIDSCMRCNDEYYSCLIRLDYVKTVHQSMNKGKDGNFEF